MRSAARVLDDVIGQIRDVAHEWRLQESDAQREGKRCEADRCRARATVLEQTAADLESQAVRADA